MAVNKRKILLNLENLEEEIENIILEMDFPDDNKLEDGEWHSDGEEPEQEDSNKRNIQEPVILIEEENNTFSAMDTVGPSHSVSSESEDDEPLSVRLSNMDGIWENKPREFEVLQFIKNFGPNIPDIVESPYEMFLQLFSKDLLEHLVFHTNLYATQSGKNFIPVTEEELRVFLGINIIMGIKQLPSYRDYWSSNPQLRDSYISPLMTVNRFGWLLSNFHTNDNTLALKAGDPGYDKLHKLRPVLDTLGKNFKESYHPGEHQSVDESMIKFKGRSKIT